MIRNERKTISGARKANARQRRREIERESTALFNEPVDNSLRNYRIIMAIVCTPALVLCCYALYRYWEMS